MIIYRSIKIQGSYYYIHFFEIIILIARCYLVLYLHMPPTEMPANAMRIRHAETKFVLTLLAGRETCSENIGSNLLLVFAYVDLSFITNF